MSREVFDERWRIFTAIETWLEIREANGRPMHPTSFRVDASHSALLARLLNGKQPLPEPPPLSFSNPWYELIEEGRAEATSVSKEAGFPGRLVINGCLWHIVEEVGPEEWVVGYLMPRISAEIRVHPSRWRVRCVGLDTRFAQPLKKWEIVRCTENHDDQGGQRGSGQGP